MSTSVYLLAFIVLFCCILFVNAAIEDVDYDLIGKHCKPYGDNGRSRECGDQFICRNNTCVTCNTYTDDCWELGFMCVNETVIFKNVTAHNNMTQATISIYRHKDLFYPNFNIWDILSSVFIFISSAVSTSAGTGGGGLYVPLLTTVGQFTPTLAIPLSKALVFGGAICNFVVLFFQRHPKSDRPLIYYDAALLLEPVTLGGTVLGVLLNTMFPEWLIVGLLIILLSVTTVMTFRKGMEVRAKEAKELAEEKRKALGLNADESDQTNEAKKDYGTYENSAEPTVDAAEETKPFRPATDKSSTEVDIPARKLTEVEEKELASILQNERKTPIWQFVSIWICWGVVLVLSLLKGGEGAGSVIGLKSCSFWYWFLTILPFPLLFSFSWLLGWRLRRNHRRKVELSYKFVDGDIEWKGFTTIVYPMYCIVAGIAAGLLGIGGGMLKGPLLLDLGALPQVAAATSSFMILLTSASTTAQFIILGRLKWDYAIWFACIGGISSVIGQFAVSWIVVKYKKTSFIIFIVALVTGLSTLLMGGQGIFNTVQDIEIGDYMGFTSPCNT